MLPRAATQKRYFYSWLLSYSSSHYWQLVPIIRPNHRRTYYFVSLWRCIFSRYASNMCSLSPLSLLLDESTAVFPETKLEAFRKLIPCFQSFLEIYVAANGLSIGGIYSLSTKVLLFILKLSSFLILGGSAPGGEHPLRSDRHSCDCSIEYPRGQHVVGWPVWVGPLRASQLAGAVRCKALCRIGFGWGIRHRCRLQHSGSTGLASATLCFYVSHLYYYLIQLQ